MNKFKSIATNLLLVIVFYIMLFQNPLEGVNGKFGMLDELVATIVIIAALIKIIFSKKKLITKYNNKIIVCVAIMLVIGLAGNLVYRYQWSKPIIKDIIVVFKGILTYVAGLIIFEDFSIEKYIKSFNIQLRIISVITFVTTFSNIVFKFLPGNEVRFGIETQQLIFSHPTFFSSFGVIVVALLSVFMKRYNKNYIYIILMLLSIITTGRTKVIAFIGMYIYLFFIVVIKKRRLERVDFLILSILGCIFAISQIKTYLENIYWARSAVTVGSIFVAKDHFPIGTGFGTYGSWVSGEVFSPVYYKYGMEVIPGLRPDFYDFIADSYWPMLLGQFGICGVIAFITIITNIYTKIKENTDLYNYLGQLIILGYLLVSSIAEASFSGPTVVIMFLLIVILNPNRPINDERSS